MQHRQLDYGEHKPQGENFPVVFLLDNVSNPKNVGAIFRLADALGVESIYLSGTTAVPPDIKIKKTSRSCDGKIPWKHVEGIEQSIDLINSKGCKIIAVELTNFSQDIFSVSLSNDFPVCLVVGNENYGVSQYCLDHADFVMHIPMMGVNSSMNVVSALAIATFEIVRQYKDLQSSASL